MNVLKKIYCRIYQFIFKLAIPLLPYSQPELLENYLALTNVLTVKDCRKVLIVTDPTIHKLGLLSNLENALNGAHIKYVIFDNIVANPTIKNVEDGLTIYLENDCNSLVALGGGSAIDCAKTIGARVVNPHKSVEKMKGLMKVKKDIPLLIAIPTTAGTGSETTLAAVITNSETKHKYAINDFPLIPKYALLDANLTLGLPPQITATTGMDALTHAVESFIGHSTTKQTRECSLKAIDLIFKNLPLVYANGLNKEARQNMLHASFLAGVAFTKSYVGYVHAVAHSLGGKYGTPHGLANAVILPNVLIRYDKSIYNKCKSIAIYTHLADDKIEPKAAFKIIVDKVIELNNKMSIPTKIDGLKVEDIDLLSGYADSEANPLYPVPRLFNKEELKQIYYDVLK